jgi:hypothetical protein
MLAFSASFQFFTMQRLQSVKISFITKSANLLHTPSVGANHILWMTCGESGLDLKPIQVIIVKFNVHGATLDQDAIRVK